MKMKRISGLIVLIGMGCLRAGWAAEPWPAEAWTAARKLTHLDAAFRKNMSGACYNPETEMFWVCCNGGPSAFWALKKNADGKWGIAAKGGLQAKYDVRQGDLEGICQADFRKDRVYLMVEGDDTIREYDTSNYGRAVLRNEWDLSAHVPIYRNGLGSEGITFVPDEWLKKGQFTDADGNPYVSQGGMGGLMFVAHQNGGRIYVFDLDATNKDIRFVGAYKSSREESSDLEFDRTSGLLYVWHNTGPNYLEVAQLSSVADGKERRLTTIREFIGPKAGNLEGFAVAPAAAREGLCLIVDDDNQDGAAIMLFERFDFTKVIGPAAGNLSVSGVAGGRRARVEVEGD